MSRTMGAVFVATLFLVGCGGTRRPALRAEMAPLGIASEPAPLQRNHFRRDRSGQVSEKAIRTILAAPVFLEEGARLGVVPVTDGYDPAEGPPLAGVPRTLSEMLEDTGLFEITSEMTAEWPADGDIRGLRELGARYRAEYLLLYRHRFVDRAYLNGWAWTWPTVLGLLFAPSHTLEAEGVLEATLFEVKTGTILFTAFERVRAERDSNVWHHDRKRRALETRLLTEAAERLGEQVLRKVHRLAAARPGSETDGLATAAPGHGAPPAPGDAPAPAL